MADRAAPGGTAYPRDPSAVVGVLGEIERQYGDSSTSGEDEELPPLNLESLEPDESTTRIDE